MPKTMHCTVTSDVLLTVMSVKILYVSRILHKNGLLKQGTRRITAAEMKYMRRTAWYTWTDYKTKTQITK